MSCKCVLVKGACPACLDKLVSITDLYLKAVLEFMAKMEWIAEAHKVCQPCVHRHADDLGAAFVTRAFGHLSDDLRNTLYARLVETLISVGVTDVTKTHGPPTTVFGGLATASSRRSSSFLRCSSGIRDDRRCAKVLSRRAARLSRARPASACPDLARRPDVVPVVLLRLWTRPTGTVVAGSSSRRTCGHCRLFVQRARKSVCSSRASDRRTKGGG